MDIVFGANDLNSVALMPVMLRRTFRYLVYETQRSSTLKYSCTMSKVKVAAFSVSLDGYGAGLDQSKEQPLGRRGEELHEWIFPTKMFKTLYGDGVGTEGVDNNFAEKSFDNLGAWIMGRNMFGPIRGGWPNDEWNTARIGRASVRGNRFA